MNPDQQNQPKEKSFGATIGIIVIVIVLVLGALYFWGGQASNQAPVPTQTTPVTNTATTTASPTTATVSQ